MQSKIYLSTRNVLKLLQRGFLDHQSYPSIRKQVLIKFFNSYKTVSVKPRYILSLTTGLIYVSAAPKLNNKELSKLLQEADTLYIEGKYEDLYSVLKDHHDSSEAEILWRLARAIYEKARDVEKDNEKQSKYEEALQLVDKALEINESCWAAHKWRAILLDYVFRFKSIKERIIHSFDIKKNILRAIELNPQDSTSYYILGEWCYTFADMPWYQRKVASAIFASPPTSTYEEALQYFQKAEEIKPHFYAMNLLMIGKCFLKMNEKEKGVLFLKQAKDYPIKTPDDKKAHEEAEKLLKGVNI